jgi:hypothetical protein
LRRAAHQSPLKLRKACDNVLDSAANGETWQERMGALAFIADRLDGKAVARIETNAGDARSLDLAALVQMVLQHRASHSTDAVNTADAVVVHTQQEGVEGEGDIPVNQQETAGGG